MLAKIGAQISFEVKQNFGVKNFYAEIVFGSKFFGKGKTNHQPLTLGYFATSRSFRDIAIQFVCDEEQ